MQVCGHNMKNGLHIQTNGVKIWYQNDQLHRLDGPAIEWADGTKFWYQYGQQHRLDGPAVEFTDSDKYWVVRDKNITKEVNAWFKETGFSSDYENWTEEDKTYFAVKWS